MPAAIAVLRVSGPAAAAALNALTGRSLPAPRSAAVRKLYDANGTLLDEAMVLWLPGPATVTGEDIVELHLHGGRAVVAGVETALGAIPQLRAAEAGEFTRRAFENGRLDLSQVEGLADLLAAETTRQRIAALTLSEGGLRRRVEDWQASILGLSARVEAAIDHDDEPDVTMGDPGTDLVALASAVQAALQVPPVERLRDGVRIGVAGPPNAGKSTLINVLAGRDVAIVSPMAGTTRDLIEVPIVLDGVPVVLIDMAGLRDAAGDAIEAEGIARARVAMARCDLLLWLGDPSEAPDGHVLRIGAQADVRAPAAGVDLAVSAVTGDGLDALRQRLRAEIEPLLPAMGDLALAAHQRAHLVSVSEALDEAARLTDPVLQAEALRSARLALDRITGRADTEAMLDALFGRFCIGK